MSDLGKRKEGREGNVKKGKSFKRLLYTFI